MIPKTKIQSAANKYADNIWPITTSLPEYGAKAFADGVKFAETELKPIITEFCEWCDEEYTQDQHGIWKNFMSSKIPENKTFTSMELLYKFLAERSEQ